MTLKKKDIIKYIQNETGITNKQSSEAVETVIGQIKESLASNDDVLISGFGKFCVKEKNERKGRNPATEQPMILPARKVVTFKCSGNLRNRINGKNY